MVQTTVLPQAKNRYKVIATASTAADAQQGAAKKAKEVCTAQHAGFVVLKDKTQYKGASKELDTVTQIASNATMFSKGIHITNTSNNPNNYRCTMLFKCTGSNTSDK